MSLRPFVDDEFIMVRLGGYDRRTAEKIAIELAIRNHSNAWKQEGPELPPTGHVELMVPPSVGSGISATDGASSGSV